VSLLDRAARSLASGESGTPAPPATDPDGMPMTRRGAVKVGAGAGLAFSALSAFGPLIESPRAEGYCFQPCVKVADSALDRQLDNTRAAVHKSYLTTAIAVVRLAFLAAAAASTVNDYGDYHLARRNCGNPNCGDPKMYPPPQGKGPPGGCSPSPPNYPCGDGCCNGDFGVCCGCTRVFQGPTCIKPDSCANC
jgi:hypothetical protein